MVIDMKLRDFDLNLLVIMEAIWAERSVTLASRSLNLSQSTISAALNRLRHSLNNEIFTFSGSEMVPTALTIQLMPEVSRILNSTGAILEGAHGIDGLIERRLTIATADYVAGMLGGELINLAAREMPNLSFDFILPKPTSEKYLSKASRLDVDLFIIPGNVLRLAGMKREFLYNDTYVCAAARSNEKLHDNISSEEFLQLEQIGYSAFPKSVYNHETLLWDEQSIEFSYRLTMSNYLIFPRILTKSDAVAILPKRLVEALSEQWDLRWVVPPLPTPPLDIFMLWRPDQDDDRALAWLRKSLKNITDIRGSDAASIG